MSVWLTIPSARPPEQANPVLQHWRKRGYKIALFRDYFTPGLIADFQMDAGVLLNGALKYEHGYPGYALAVNNLIEAAWIADADAEWFIAAGDDTLPEPNHSAEEIAAQCKAHFQAANFERGDIIPEGNKWSTFGVMQPTGDRWGDRRGAYIDRVAGSAWIGREFARRAYGGRGPLWPEYQHMFVDQELQAVATKLGVFWQRPDLTQRHQHWGRGKTDAEIPDASSRMMPPHLLKWNTTAHWNESKAIFEAREKAGFPGCEPL